MSTSWMDLLSHRWGEGWKAQEAVWRWRAVVGESLAKLARALYVEDGVLHIAAVSPVVANELRLWSREILARLAVLAPESHVRALRFQIVAEPGEVAAEAAAVTALELNQAEEIIPENLSPSLRTRLVRLLAQAFAQERVILANGGRRCPACGAAFFGEGDRCPLCRLVP